MVLDEMHWPQKTTVCAWQGVQRVRKWFSWYKESRRIQIPPSTRIRFEGGPTNMEQ